MRVIAGDMKGRKLKAVPGILTRPTTDKVKEAVFQVIGPFFQGGMCLDLFAGSGSLGIEAISRGMEKTVFVDQHPKAIHTIHQNLQLFDIEKKADVFRTDAYRALQASAKRDLQFDLILMDPPYGEINYDVYLHAIEELDLLNDHGMIYCEHDAAEFLPDNLDDVSIMKQANFGGTIGITIYRKH